MAKKKKGPYEKGCMVCLVIIILIIAGFIIFRSIVSAPFRARQKAYALTDSQYPFDESLNSNLSRKQLEKYTAIRQDLLPHIKEFLSLLEDMRAEKQEGESKLRLGVKVVKEMSKLAGVLQDVHIAALNEHKMSVTEYRWIGRRAFAVLHHGAQEGWPEYLKVWASVELNFIQGAPRIAKYQEKPPDLIARLDLQPVVVTEEEADIMLEFQEKLFEPYAVLYQEVSLVLQSEEDEE